MSKKKTINWPELSNTAQEWAMEFVKSHPLGLGSLGEEGFKKAMDAVMMVAVNAYVAGFYKGRG